jgi:hypothetical protein
LVFFFKSTNAKYYGYKRKIAAGQSPTISEKIYIPPPATGRKSNPKIGQQQAMV